MCPHWPPHTCPVRRITRDGHFLEGNGGEKKAGSEHRRLCLCVGAVRCGLSWATPEGSPVSHSGSVKNLTEV